MTIKEMREYLGENKPLSKAAFSQMYKIPVRTLEDWESGKRKPPDYVMYLLERAVRYDKKYKIKDKKENKMKLNNLLKDKITAYGFEAFREYASLGSQSGQETIVSTLSPADMYEKGINLYYAPVLRRGQKFNTAEEVKAADLDVQLVSVFNSIPWDMINEDKIVIVSRHQGTLEILQNMYPDAPVLSGNVTPEEIDGCHVIGTLPPNLVQYCMSYRAVTINDFDYSKDGDLSGQELDDRIVIHEPITIEMKGGE